MLIPFQTLPSSICLLYPLYACIDLWLSCYLYGTFVAHPFLLSFFLCIIPRRTWLHRQIWLHFQKSRSSRDTTSGVVTNCSPQCVVAFYYSHAVLGLNGSESVSEFLHHRLHPACGLATYWLVWILTVVWASYRSQSSANYWTYNCFGKPQTRTGVSLRQPLKYMKLTLKIFMFIYPHFKKKNKKTLSSF